MLSSKRSYWNIHLSLFLQLHFAISHVTYRPNSILLWLRSVSLWGSPERPQKNQVHGKPWAHFDQQPSRWRTFTDAAAEDQIGMPAPPRWGIHCVLHFLRDADMQQMQRGTQSLHRYNISKDYIESRLFHWQRLDIKNDNNVLNTKYRVMPNITWNRSNDITKTI